MTLLDLVILSLQFQAEICLTKKLALTNNLYFETKRTRGHAKEYEEAKIGLMNLKNIPSTSRLRLKLVVEKILHKSSTTDFLKMFFFMQGVVQPANRVLKFKTVIFLILVFTRLIFFAFGSIDFYSITQKQLLKN